MIFGRQELDALAERYARPHAARWTPVPEELDRAIAADRELAEAGARARRDLAREVSARLVGLVSADEVARFREALSTTPRERFVMPEEIAWAAVDAPSPLDPLGLATVSAPHAYVLSYSMLGLAEGDHLVELGTGTGYGAALASRIVGPRGLVTSIEIDPALHERARHILSDPETRGPSTIALHVGNARDLAPAIVAEAARRPEPLRITVTYAVARPPDDLLALLPEGGRLAAPVGDDDQMLLCWTREGDALHRAVHGAVRYVAERG